MEELKEELRFYQIELESENSQTHSKIPETQRKEDTNIFENLISTSNLEELICKAEKDLQQQLETWRKQEEIMRKESEKGFDTVILDIGGKRMKTTKATLSESLYFEGLFRSDWKPDSDGAFFVDKSAAHFSIILNYLRTGYFPFHLDPLKIQKIFKDFDFFQIRLHHKAMKKLDCLPNTTRPF